MRGLMSERPLLISSLIEHAARYHGDAEIVSRTVEGRIHRYTYARGRAPRHAAGPGAAAARHRARRPGRHARLERLSPFRALLRRLRHRRGLPHDQPAAVRRADRLHRQPRRGSAAVRRPDASCRWSSGWRRNSRAVPPLRRDDRPGAHADHRACRTLLCYEELIAAERTRTSPGPSSTRRRPRRCATPRAPPASPRASLYSHRSTVLHAYGVSLPDAISGARSPTTGLPDRADVSRQCAGACPTPRR